VHSVHRPLQLQSRKGRRPVVFSVTGWCRQQEGLHPRCARPGPDRSWWPACAAPQFDSRTARGADARTSSSSDRSASSINTRGIGTFTCSPRPASRPHQRNQRFNEPDQRNQQKPWQRLYTSIAGSAVAGRRPNPDACARPPRTERPARGDGHTRSRSTASNATLRGRGPSTSTPAVSRSLPRHVRSPAARGATTGVRRPEPPAPPGPNDSDVVTKPHTAVAAGEGTRARGPRCGQRRSTRTRPATPSSPASRRAAGGSRHSYQPSSRRLTNNTTTSRSASSGRQAAKPRRRGAQHHVGLFSGGIRTRVGPAIAFRSQAPAAGRIHSTRLENRIHPRRRNRLDTPLGGAVIVIG